MSTGKNTVDRMINKLDNILVKKWDDYIKLHESLDQYRGKSLSETNLHEANKILKQIQLAFHEIYPAYNFIAYRYQSAVNAINEYNNFIESIKTAGAKEEPLPSEH